MGHLRDSSARLDALQLIIRENAEQRMGLEVLWLRARQALSDAEAVVALAVGYDDTWSEDQLERLEGVVTGRLLAILREGLRASA